MGSTKIAEAVTSYTQKMGYCEAFRANDDKGQRLTAWLVAARSGPRARTFRRNSGEARRCVCRGSAKRFERRLVTSRSPGVLDHVIDRVPDGA